MAWFESKKKYTTISGRRRSNVPEGLYDKCPNCYSMVYRREFEDNLRVCPNCGHHSRITAEQRVELLTDPDTFKPIATELAPKDILNFEAKKKYAEQIQSAQEKSGKNDALIAGSAKLEGIDIALAVMDFGFLGGSMGAVVGEKVTRAMELALKERKPIITVTSTGGARMMESIISLMQMAKTSALCAKLDEAGVPFISVLADPSTAGVMASFAALGDIIIAEPGCLVGFAGRRVIEQTVRERLPLDFQTAEFVRDHGFIDKVVHRHELKATLARTLRHLWAGSAQVSDIAHTTAQVGA